MTKHYIDISNLRDKFPDMFTSECPDLIPICKGNYGKDWDVVEEELTPEFKTSLRKAVAARMPFTPSEELPIGFNDSAIPPEAKIITTTEEDI